MRKMFPLFLLLLVTACQPKKEEPRLNLVIQAEKARWDNNRLTLINCNKAVIALPTSALEVQRLLPLEEVIALWPQLFPDGKIRVILATLGPADVYDIHKTVVEYPKLLGNNELILDVEELSFNLSLFDGGVALFLDNALYIKELQQQVFDRTSL